ncbi:MAG: hypothetical protein EP335_16460 [Alphaproteobacteria bacterium]|nr:MAG: hypothetical protein EP335_16460 [Alphaproteobacteria bacterium]
MADWLSYNIQDFLMYAPGTYYRLFGLYNAAIWPTQLLAGAGTLFLLWQLNQQGRHMVRMAYLLLAVAFGAVAAGYFWSWYSGINWAAPYFAGAFALQALLLFGAAITAGPVAPWEGPPVWQRATGILVLLAAVFAVPLLPPLDGRPYGQAELFGLMPDPTVIGTFGAFMALGRVRWFLYVVPALWAAIGGAFLWAMESPLWWLMPAAALMALGVRLLPR